MFNKNKILEHNMTCKEFLDHYGSAVRNQWTWVSGNSDRQTIRQAVFIAAAKLLAGGYKDHTLLFP